MAANHVAVVVEAFHLFETAVQGALQSIVLSPYCLWEGRYGEREEDEKVLADMIQVSLAC